MLLMMMNAYIMAHELVHGEKRHSVSILKEKIDRKMALGFYLESDDAVLNSDVLKDIAFNEEKDTAFTKEQEMEADDLGFQYLVTAGYNPGAAAAAMSVLAKHSEERNTTGTIKDKSSSNYSTVSERMKENAGRMYKYSGKHVKVENGWLVINGEKIFMPLASGRYTQQERAYLTAGKMARLYHDEVLNEFSYLQGIVYNGSASFYQAEPGEKGEEITMALNKVIAKDRKIFITKKS